MTRTVKTAKILGNTVYQHTGLKSRRIHLFNFWSKDGVCPQLAAEFKVPLKIAGIPIKVLARAELGGVNKYAYNYLGCPAQGLFHQGKVSPVKIPHGRDKTDGVSFTVAFVSPPGHLSVGSQYFHQRGLLVRQASPLRLGTKKSR